MRMILLAGLLVIAPAEAATSDRAITTNIDLSEWHPPLKLALNIESGEYQITPPKGPWPAWQPKPEATSGVASKPLRQDLRRAFDAAAVDLANPRCAKPDGLSGNILASNAGIPDLVLHVGGKSLRAGRSTNCWTRATEALQRLLEVNFSQARK